MIQVLPPAAAAAVAEAKSSAITTSGPEGLGDMHVAVDAARKHQQAGGVDLAGRSLDLSGNRRRCVPPGCRHRGGMYRQPLTTVPPRMQIQLGHALSCRSLQRFQPRSIPRPPSD